LKKGGYFQGKWEGGGREKCDRGGTSVCPGASFSSCGENEKENNNGGEGKEKGGSLRAPGEKGKVDSQTNRRENSHVSRPKTQHLFIPENSMEGEKETSPNDKTFPQIFGGKKRIKVNTQEKRG